MDFVNNEIGGRLRRINRAIGQVCSRKVSELELTPRQGYILGYLARHREQKLTASELGRLFELTPPTISGVLRRLESKGFIRLDSDAEDRRRKWVTVTDKALLCHAEVGCKMIECERRLITGLSREELAQLTLLLDKLIENLSAQTGEMREVSHD